MVTIFSGNRPARVPAGARGPAELLIRVAFKEPSRCAEFGLEFASMQMMLGVCPALMERAPFTASEVVMLADGARAAYKGASTYPWSRGATSR